MLILFGLGSVGTVLGVIIGMQIVDGTQSFGALYPALAGMFTGTYTGGSINFNAVALHYGVMENGVLYAGATAVDNIITALWMAVTLIIPNLLLPKKKKLFIEQQTKPEETGEIKEESVGISSLAILASLGLFSLMISNSLESWSKINHLPVPSILILTTIALILAQMPFVKKLQGGHIFGLFSIYLFLAVIGAYCEFAAMIKIGHLAWKLMALVITIVVVHGVWLAFFVKVGKFDPEMAVVASQANIGGSSSALALAKSIQRMDLYLPGILVGSLGNGLGTYLGFMVASWLS